MKKHSPLLEEKLNLEGEAVKDVLLAYEKVSMHHTKKKTITKIHTLLQQHHQSILNFVDKDCELCASVQSTGRIQGI